MELIFLGTSAGAPTKQRNVTGLALRTGGGWDLFDCGEATQHQLLRTNLSLPKLRRVFISHLHGDHCFGLFGLLGSRAMNGATSPLVVYGPAGLDAMVRTVLKASSMHLTYPLDIVEIRDGAPLTLETGQWTIEAIELAHRVTSYGWSIREQERPGLFDVAAARAAGVPDGPLFGDLQRGEAVALAGGRRVESSEVIGPPRSGRRLIVAGDNSAPHELFERTDGADVVVHEATFTEPVVASVGDDYGHSTAARVAKAAEATGVRNLILTHFSPRYGGDGGGTDEVHDEARSHFSGGLHLANDFDRVVVSPDGDAISVEPAHQ